MSFKFSRLLRGYSVPACPSNYSSTSSSGQGSSTPPPSTHKFVVAKSHLTTLSTGGIIALGLGVKNWPVEDCIKYFKELCREAFSPREMIGIPLLEKLAMLSHGSMYKTRPFEALLRKRFEERPLFGGDINESEMLTKVAVTSTTAVAQHAVVLANYNRPDPSEYGESSSKIEEAKF